jgi:hypothetical protein
VKKLNGSFTTQDRVIDGRTESEWILERLAEGCGVDSVGSGCEPVEGSCKHCFEASGSGDT